MLKGILAIAGQPGLFKLVTEGKNNIIVESLLTGKRQPAYATSKISSLEDIAIYTTEGDKPLKEVFQAMAEKTNGEKALSHKSSKNDLVAFFEEALPNYDQDQVYVSDIKKVIQWFNLLAEKGLLNFEEEATEETSKSEEE